MLKNKFLLEHAAIVVAVAGLLNGCFSAGSEKLPKKGSVDFGAKEPPVVNISPEFTNFKTIFADIAEKVIPTVVSITSTQIDTIYYRSNPFDMFGFGFPFDDSRQRQQPQARERRQSGVGSGVIVSGDGYILTNSHVVNGANEIKVKLYDDTEYSAKIIGVDTLSDVAVVKISSDIKNLPVAYLGNSGKLRPGDWVMAIGNPFNLSSTVTTGIVSALGRYTETQQYQNFIQTDAAINPGNSGGALVNIEGELIGINTMIYTRSGGYMGIGFAIPISMAKDIMEQLIYTGEVKRGWLGVSIGNIDQSMNDALGLKEKGVLINEVFDNEPAQKAGIESGDVVVSLDGKKTPNANELRNIVATLSSGKKYPIEIIRNGKKITLMVTPSVRGENQNLAIGEKEESTTDNKTLGISLKESGKGAVIVESVDEKKSAAKSGIRSGDIILSIKTSPDKPFVEINSVKDFNKEIKDIKGDFFVLRLNRNGEKFFVSVKIQK
ncbi:MAG: Do family serine endopeptidase [Chitinispirillales bacterium]|jgi:serine protease Do|nr:Do family serine endopeptidase [Chitinispirillales bacterium]